LRRFLQQVSTTHPVRADGGTSGDLVGEEARALLDKLPAPADLPLFSDQK
jgi:hypothetical protein